MGEPSEGTTPSELIKIDPNRCGRNVANRDVFKPVDCTASVQDALRDFFPQIKTKDTRADFYTAYQRESSQYDHDYVKKYDEDLNTTLVFVSLPYPEFLSVVVNLGEGRSVLSRELRVRHRGTIKIGAGIRRNECCVHALPHPLRQ